jgi:ATP-dependent RNA helicase CshB
MKFLDLNIKKEILDALEKHNFSDMTEVQEKVIPHIFKRKKVIVHSPSGSGKTLAFAVPIMNELDLESNSVQALILAPTNELAKQIYDVFRIFAKELNFKVDTIDNAFEYKKDSILPKVVIGTPKKTLDVYSNHKFPLTTIKTLILDEVDMIVDLGFLEEIEKLIIKINDDVLIHCYSATIPLELQNFIKKYIKGNVEKISLKKTREGNNVTHYFIKIKQESKVDYLVDKIVTGEFNPYMAMIFAYDKPTANEMYQKLISKGVKGVTIISSDQEKRKRINTLKRINNDEYQFIIATDVASRGIDIVGLSHVVHLGAPFDYAYYIHRCGRTGRFNSTGESYLLLNKGEMIAVSKLSSRYNLTIIEKQEITS